MRLPPQDVCDPLRLYIHTVCTAGWGEGKGGKAGWYGALGLWVVDQEGAPLYDDPQTGGPPSDLGFCVVWGLRDLGFV